MEWREPKDIDFFYKNGFCPESLYRENSIRYEGCLIPDEIFDAIESRSSNNIPCLEDLYTIKLSHCFWSLKHDKTISDIILISRKGIEPNIILFNLLKRHWKTVHGNKDFLSLRKTKAEFFDNAITEIIEHDKLHEIVAFNEEPVYRKCLKKNNEVLLDYNKFSLLTHQEKIDMFREEIMVIALERYAIPNQFDLPSGVCYYRAFKTVLTRLVKGRFANFMAFNMDEILSYNMVEQYKKVKELIND